MTGAALAVAVDGESLVDGSGQRGIGTYLRHLLDGLTADGSVRPLLLAQAAPRTGPLTRFTQRPGVRRARHDRALPGRISASGAEVFHSPAQAPPASSPVPWVQTLHDLTPFVIDSELLAADRRWWQQVGPRLLGAAAVICVSESAADQAVRYLDLPADRLHVVPHGVDPIFTPTGARQVEADPYLLWVSAWGPHKGLDDALAVVAQLAAAGQPHRLVIVGPSDEWMRRQVDLAIVRSPRPDLARVAGYVEDLPAFYRGAAALMVTSRAEGFGLPALEAMACGTPVVAYANTSLPELVGDAGVLVDDGDLAGFAAAVADLLTDDAAQADLRAAGPHRAAAYTWARSVAAHIEIYRSISSAV